MNDEQTRDTQPEIRFALTPAAEEVLAPRARIATIGAMCVAARDALCGLDPEAALANIEAAIVEAGRS